MAWQLMGNGCQGQVIACANAHSLVQAQADPGFAEALRAANLLVADGAGILLAGKILGRRFPERVAGTEFFRALSSRANREGGVRYFFLGSTERVLHRLKERLASDYPRITVAGTYSPPFKSAFDEIDNARMLEIVNGARPDVLWVGMTAPKQEKWIYQNQHNLEVPLVGAIGAVFDFYAGTKKRAPAWVCDLGLEWLVRTIYEPRRLWRRQFVSIPVFLCMVVRQKLKRVRP